MLQGSWWAICEKRAVHQGTLPCLKTCCFLPLLILEPGLGLSLIAGNVRAGIPLSHVAMPRKGRCGCYSPASGNKGMALLDLNGTSSELLSVRASGGYGGEVLSVVPSYGPSRPSLFLYQADTHRVGVLHRCR